MNLHPLRIHFGFHLGVVAAKLNAYARQLTPHLNTLIRDSGHQFVLISVDNAVLPGPEPNPAVLPEQFVVDLYLFDNSLNPTQNGTLSIGGDGRVRLFVPARWLQMVGTPTFGLPDYAQTLGTICHEFEHNWRSQGEPRQAMFGNPPAGFPMPTMSLWNFPNDAYWTQDKRPWILDPLCCSMPINHPLFPEATTLEWMLANTAPSPWTCVIMRGKRGAAPWSGVFHVNVVGAEAGTPTWLTGWLISAHYEDPWELQYDKTNLVGGPFELAWSERNHGAPLVALHVDSNRGGASGYLSIFDLENHAARFGVGTIPVLTADIATGMITMPDITWPPIPPWENDPQWKGAPRWLQASIVVEWLLRNNKHTSPPIAQAA